jgi:hypothetical protein
VILLPISSFTFTFTFTAVSVCANETISWLTLTSSRTLEKAVQNLVPPKTKLHSFYSTFNSALHPKQQDGFGGISSLTFMYVTEG